MGESKAAFGPVVERIVFSSDIGKDFFFDIDTDKTFTPPTSLTRSSPPNEVIEWSLENGIDFLNDNGRFELTPQTIFVKVSGDLWKASFDEAKNALKAGFPEKDVIPPHDKEPDLPITYTFETREGGFGLLQIMEINNGNLKIRYKIVSQGTQVNSKVSPIKSASISLQSPLGASKRISYALNYSTFLSAVLDWSPSRPLQQLREDLSTVWPVRRKPLMKPLPVNMIRSQPRSI